MVAEVFIGIWFWVLTLTAFGAIAFAVEKEKGAGATICFAVYLALIHLFGDATLIQSFGSYWEWFIAAGVLYFMVGAGWSLAKWFFWNKQKAGECLDNYCAVRRSFLRDKLGSGPLSAEITEKTTVPENLHEEWTKYIEGRHQESGFRQDDGVCIDIHFTVPRAQDHKSSIIMWMSFWPASAALTMTRDPIRNICVAIYNSLTDKYQELAERAWSSAIQTRKGDVAPPPVLEEDDPSVGPTDQPDLTKRIPDPEPEQEEESLTAGEDPEEKSEGGLIGAIKGAAAKLTGDSDSSSEPEEKKA